MTEIYDINDGKMRRFSRGRIVEHALIVVTFMILVVTGLSQRFFYLDISQWFILKWGGIDSVRLIHRAAGAVFVAAAACHIVIAASGVILKRWQPSMIINMNDFTDAVHDMQYYIGLKNSPARCDRYTYKQKFEYWGILTGGLLMIGTGLVLWFPTQVVRSLPGELIPVAKALHSNEAMVIVLLIAVWHIYNSIFSPEVFPLDTSIFTGYISRERMIREHPLELLRRAGLAEEGSEAAHREEREELKAGEASPR